MKINKSYIKQIIKEELEAVLGEGSYEDEIFKGEEYEQEERERRRLQKMSDPSPTPAHLRGSSEPRNNMSSEEIEDTMTSLAKQLQAQGFGVSLKINGKKKV